MSNLHKDLEEEKLHVAKGFSLASKGGILWKDEKTEQSFSSRLLLPPILGRAASNAAAPSENDGDTYLLRGTRGPLTISSIAWQSANTVRYSFSGSPNLSTYTAGDYIYFKETTSSVNSGDFVITAVNDASDWIEVSNVLVEDATYDQAGAAGTGASTTANWDGCRQQSWAKYNAALDKWYGIDLIAGNVMYDSVAKIFWLYDGTSSVPLIASGEWTTPTFSAGNFTATVGTFTVDSGDIVANRYIIEGKKMTWCVTIIDATFASSLTSLKFTIPESKTAKSTTTQMGAYVSSGATVYTDTFVGVVAAGNYVVVNRASSAVIANVTNGGFVSFTITFEIE